MTLNEAEHFLTLYGQKRNVTIPIRETITEQDRQQFDTVYKKLGEYNGRPEPIMAAFEIAKEIESQPLFAAAMARVVQTSAYSHGDVYDEKLMEESVEWVELAESVAPDEKKVLHTAIDVHLSNKNYEPSKRALDQGKMLYPDAFEFKLSDLYILNRTGTLRQVRKVIAQVDENSLTTDQRLLFFWAAAGSFLAHKEWKQSAKLYDKVTKLEPDNPWAWHNLSIARLNDKKTIRAFLANRKALGLMDFGMARHYQKEIRAKLITRIARVVILTIVAVLYLLYSAGLFEGVF